MHIYLSVLIILTGFHIFLLSCCVRVHVLKENGLVSKCIPHGHCILHGTTILFRAGHLLGLIHPISRHSDYASYWTGKSCQCRYSCGKAFTLWGIICRQETQLLTNHHMAINGTAIHSDSRTSTISDADHKRRQAMTDEFWVVTQHDIAQYI